MATIPLSSAVLGGSSVWRRECGGDPFLYARSAVSAGFGQDLRKRRAQSWHFVRKVDDLCSRCMSPDAQGMKSVEIGAPEAANNAAFSLWSRYVGLLDSHPLVMKSLTAGLLNAFSDLFCQIVVEKSQTIDFQRLLSFTAIGIFMSGPGMHYWYGFLPKLIPYPGVLGLALRIAADQFVFTPLGTGTFFAVLLTLEGRNQQLWSKLQQDWLPTVIANWKVWIPFQLVNFGLVPPQLQAGAACLLGVIWSVFISFAGHKK
ncbi:PXMP2/4 family protein 2-like [Selaginella moellendorffii]|uniref:PXMP2/4 family protein 2-like n=1 Tax=Selaginella moellendorffii TaxID=88036 RepID=UPI000D1C3868|nr:PXMP2/4 family protein 2-like [Selaginella moellendorffii]|eukprot:XP_024520528.1 PXMP2/4 family protein 2-like [Selaginella moellendorffii]